MLITSRQQTVKMFLIDKKTGWRNIHLKHWIVGQNYGEKVKGEAKFTFLGGHQP